jgi:hypothetical protein
VFPKSDARLRGAKPGRRLTRVPVPARLKIATSRNRARTLSPTSCISDSTVAMVSEHPHPLPGRTCRYRVNWKPIPW